MTTAPAPSPTASLLDSILPGAPRSPVGNIDRSIIWLHGDPKIGKTTFAAGFPGAWFLATERGQDWLTVRQPTLIESWAHFKQVGAAIVEKRPTHFTDGSPILTLVIDTYDLLFKMCFNEECRAMGISDPGEIPHGGGWGRIDKEFSRVMTIIARLPYGLVLISHTRQKEFKTRGIKTDRYEPNIGAAGMRWANQAADLIGHAFVQEVAALNAKGEPTGGVEERRMLRVHPTASAVAGGRFADILPSVVPLSYDALHKALIEGRAKKNAATGSPPPQAANSAAVDINSSSAEAEISEPDEPQGGDEGGAA